MLTFGCFGAGFEKELSEVLSILPMRGGHHDAGKVIWPKQVPSFPLDEHVAVLEFMFVLDEKSLLLFLYPESWVANSWTQIVEGDDLYDEYPLLPSDCSLLWCSLCIFCLSA